MSKPQRIDRAYLSPEWPVKDTAIALLFVTRYNKLWVTIPVAVAIAGLWCYRHAQMQKIDKIGIAGEDCA